MAYRRGGRDGNPRGGDFPSRISHCRIMGIDFAIINNAAGSAAMIRGMRFIMIVGILAVPVMHVILQRLLAMVDTVREGDPFVLENAGRLHTIAWSVLGLEVLHLVIGAIATQSASSVQPLDINSSFSITPWIAVLLLFVLARVFDHGARLRADLEGTV